jgi:hypothetical protein
MDTEVNAVVAALRQRIEALETRQREKGESGLNTERLGLQSQLGALLRVSEQAYVGERVTVTLEDGSTFVSRVYEVIPAQPRPLHIVIHPQNGARHAVPFDMLKHAGGEP